MPTLYVTWEARPAKPGRAHAQTAAAAPLELPLLVLPVELLLELLLPLEELPVEALVPLEPLTVDVAVLVEPPLVPDEPLLLEPVLVEPTLVAELEAVPEEPPAEPRDEPGRTTVVPSAVMQTPASSQSKTSRSSTGWKLQAEARANDAIARRRTHHLVSATMTALTRSAPPAPQRMSAVRPSF